LGAELDNEVFEVNACEEIGEEFEADDDNDEVLCRRDPSTDLAWQLVELDVSEWICLTARRAGGDNDE